MISFRLVEIDTIQFALLDVNPVNEEEVSLRTKINLSAHASERMVVAAPHFTFLAKEQPFIVIQVACAAEIDASDWNEQIIVDAHQLKLPKDLALHLLVLATGTTRGVLHEKLKTTKYEKYILPTIDLTQMITEDIYLSICEEEE